MAAPRYGEIIEDMLNAERYDKTSAYFERQVQATRRVNPLLPDAANLSYASIPVMPDMASIERGLAYRSDYRLQHTARIPALSRVQFPENALACYLKHENRHGVDYYWCDYLVRN